MRMTIRIWILIAAILLSVLAIHPSFEKGVEIKSVDINSAFFEEGLRSGEIIKQINQITVNDLDDFSNATSDLFPNNDSVKVVIKTDKAEHTAFVNTSLGITVADIPSTSIKTGLDLSGGARALVQADKNLTDAELQDLVEVSSNRFNVYGISDVQIKGVTDISGQKFMLIEVAGATPTDLENLIAQQGKFEAKVGNTTVFEGGKGDISDVCRNNAQCAGISSCDQSNGAYYCNFMFTIYLTPEAAQRQADTTANLSLDSTGQYLSQKLYLYVDEKLVDELNVGKDLKGQATTQISIQGSGTGATQDDAYVNAQENMKKLQTVLLTGSLPYKLSIVKLDTISPNLGDQFIKIILYAGLASIIVVSLIIFARYRKFKLSMALLITSFSEVLIILGVASLIKWNLDLPSMAGILATIGTGVDSQIIIIDEAETSRTVTLKERLKRALFIILASYATAAASLLPLYWAGAGLLKGFAITSLIGITAGVFISRPAFADMIRNIEE